MVGRADPGLARVPDDPDEPQFMWHNDSHFDGGTSSGYVPLEPQESCWRVDSDGEPLYHWGPEATLALGARVYLAKFAMFSTRIREHWHPEEPTSHFAAFVGFCQRALASAPPPARFEGLFWLQGESDASADKHAKNAYKADLVRLVQALRVSLEAPMLPLVASHIVWPQEAAAVNEAISGACEELPYARHTPADGLCVADDGHLDTASVLEVGRRMGKAYREMIRPRRVAGSIERSTH